MHNTTDTEGSFNMSDHVSVSSYRSPTHALKYMFQFPACHLNSNHECVTSDCGV